MPHLVEMHHKYSKAGLVVISVAIEDQEDKDAKNAALKVLKSKGAVYTNLLLDEPVEVWQNKLRFASTPCIYVFNRQGKWTQIKSDDRVDPIDHDEVEKLVVQLLREK